MTQNWPRAAAAYSCVPWVTLCARLLKADASNKRVSFYPVLSARLLSQALAAACSCELDGPHPAALVVLLGRHRISPPGENTPSA